MSSRKQALVWIDLEMTGLDPESCAIVEMAMVITDRELNEIADPLQVAIWQPESVLETMCPYVRRMHETSGLLASVRESTTGVDEAEQQALERVTQHAAYRTARLCGNTVSQDRRFLAKYMPALENYLHYRHIDVSTVKELAYWWYGSKYQKPQEGKHTALFDIRQSIEELRYYRNEIFR